MPETIGLENVQLARTNIMLEKTTQGLKLAEVASRMNVPRSVLAVYLKNNVFALQMQAITERALISNRLC